MPNIANKFILPDGTEINFENGIPEGGTPGQVLTKQSDTNGDVSWQNPSVSDEQVTTAVNSYLEENPVSGMTAEQEQRLNQNTQDVADLKSTMPKVDSTLSNTGEAADAKVVGDAIQEINNNIGNISTYLDTLNGEVI